MSVLDLRPVQLDVWVRPGNDATAAITVDGLTLTSPTVVAPIVNRDGTTPAVSGWAVDVVGQVISLTLTDADTEALGLGSFTWSLDVTIGAGTQSLIAGTLSLSDKATRAQSTAAAIASPSGADVELTVVWGGQLYNIDGGTAAATGTDSIDGGTP